MGRLVFPGRDCPLLRHHAPELARELGLLCLPGREEERAASDRVAALEHDPLEAFAPFELDDALLTNPDPVPLQSRELFRWNLRRPIGAQHEIAAPAGEFERQPEPARAAPVNRQRLIAHFPAVAVRTVKNALAVQLLE